MLKLTTDKHEASRSLSATAELLVEILALLEREVNFKQNIYNSSHQTFSLLLHYFAKVRSMKLW